MTDITELAQREKFEAWWEREYKHLESSKYTDAVPHIKYGFWMAYQAGGAELVEALEKAQRANAAQDDHINQQQDRIDQLEKGHQEAAKQINSWRRMAKQNIAEREKDIAELDAARQRIAELESRTVKLPQRLQPGADGYDDWYVHSDDDGEYLKVDDVLAMLTAAGIKVEAE
ncbi:hypothetical protein L3495_09575 [Klebsiella pneumoniae]|uniref:hypothetical protein n=1 Tax=Klebsiella pneumoniae TaxID=573 RepID=UPI00227AEBD9|nr:hypothetical protein [Klebsiella pneumoniae]MCY4774650.1 hypothetical protein [Klebsiella pneumoniae]MDG0035040.1 hypothetical protein [Klebsiella pneumoniae]